MKRKLWTWLVMVLMFTLTIVACSSGGGSEHGLLVNYRSGNLQHYFIEIHNC